MWWEIAPSMALCYGFLFAPWVLVPAAHYMWIGKPNVRHPNGYPQKENFRRDKELDPTGGKRGELTVYLEGLPAINPYSIGSNK